MHTLGHMNPAIVIWIRPEWADQMVMVNDGASLARVNWWESRVRVWRGSFPITLSPAGPKGVTEDTSKGNGSSAQIPSHGSPWSKVISLAQPGVADLAVVNPLDDEDEGGLAKGRDPSSQRCSPSKGH